MSTRTNHVYYVHAYGLYTISIHIHNTLVYIDNTQIFPYAMLYYTYKQVEMDDKPFLSALVKQLRRVHDMHRLLLRIKKVEVRECD